MGVLQVTGVVRGRPAEQRVGGRLVRDEHVEVVPAQGAEDRLGLLHAAGQADDVGQGAQLVECDPDPARRALAGHDGAAPVEPLAEHVPDATRGAESGDLVSGVQPGAHRARGAQVGRPDACQGGHRRAREVQHGERTEASSRSAAAIVAEDASRGAGIALRWLLTPFVFRAVISRV